MHFTLHSLTVRWAIALAAWIVIAFILIAFKRVAIRISTRFAEKTKTTLDDKIVLVFRSISPLFLWIIALAFATPLAPARLGPVVKDIVVIMLGMQILISGTQLIGPVIAHFLFREEREESQTARNALDIMVKLVLWIAVALLVLENLGVKISTLIAGLGVGGIAAGLALQNVAGDLFASVSIMLDKPFQIGDYIVINNFSGNVERIGIKSTRIRSLTGEELIVPNMSLTVGNIQNYKRMDQRRIVFSFGVIYSTPPEVMRQIPGIVQTIVDSDANAKFNQCTFLKFGPSSLDFQVIYYTAHPDYALYMDTQANINLQLLEEFNKRGIEFAFPTQTIHMAPSEAPRDEPHRPSPSDSESSSSTSTTP